MQPNRPASPKNPAIAIALNFALPGAGHLYLGAKGKGLAYMAAAFAMVAYVFYAMFQAALAVSEGGQLEEVMAQAPGIGLIAGVAFPILMAVAMADAWFTAKKQN